MRANVYTGPLGDKILIGSRVESGNDRIGGTDTHMKKVTRAAVKFRVDEVVGAGRDIAPQQKVGDERRRTGHDGSVGGGVETNRGQKRGGGWIVLVKRTAIGTPSTGVTLAVLDLDISVDSIGEDDADITLLPTRKSLNTGDRFAVIGGESGGGSGVLTEEFLGFEAGGGGNGVLGCSGGHLVVWLTAFLTGRCGFKFMRG